MFVWKKTHDSMIAHYSRLFDARGEVISDRDATIGRLQRENARLLAEVSGLRSDVTAAEMAYEESHKAHKRVAAELATLKAERDRRMAPLIAANAARAAKARERAGSVG